MAAFEEALPSLTAAGLDVVALSTDDRDQARSLVERCGLTFPVGYGLPLHETARRLGTYYEDRRGILHAASFVLDPERAVAVATYSSGAVGRLEPEELLSLLATWKRREENG